MTSLDVENVDADFASRNFVNDDIELSPKPEIFHNVCGSFHLKPDIDFLFQDKTRKFLFLLLGNLTQKLLLLTLLQ